MIHDFPWKRLYHPCSETSNLYSQGVGVRLHGHRPLPEPAELALKVADLKIAAASRGLTMIEVKEDKLMLKRNDDYVMAKGKFPRLRQKGPAARLKEIKKVVLALENAHAFRVPSGVESRNLTHKKMPLFP